MMTPEQAATIFAPVTPTPGFDATGAWLIFGGVVLAAVVLPLIIAAVCDHFRYR